MLTAENDTRAETLTLSKLLYLFNRAIANGLQQKNKPSTDHPKPLTTRFLSYL
ncbi:hypothetical protein FC85_GL001817 [Lentilactobacillus diolivorans DSM 14421]|uniref:Uncharacterized protein n=1 Tax=Lentilactobacillus diolivorans DSM 14421 TaxID=1423739 RepID=A0A0R1S8G6_9LACO|nr:hypothetical protein FC85_GL001817 [Lentilactobacillus diolivorans DSM 14421]